MTIKISSVRPACFVHKNRQAAFDIVLPNFVIRLIGEENISFLIN